MTVVDGTGSERGNEALEPPVDYEYEEDPLAPFDLSTPKKVRIAGDEITQEIEAAHSRYPEAAEAWNENADLDEFFEVAGIDGESSIERATRARIRWLTAAIAAWLEYVAETGIASREDVQHIVDQFNLEPKDDTKTKS